MAGPARSPVRRVLHAARVVFRWCRITVLFAILGGMVAALWLNRVGLPAWLKDRLVSELHERGVDLQFTRMRLHWYRGIVAENVQLGRPAETNAPQLAASEAEMLIDGRALLHRRLRVAGVALRGGRLTLPVWGTNATPQELLVQKISGKLRFGEPDRWELEHFQAQTFGVKVLLTGAVTNASSLKKLNLGRKSPANARSSAAFWYDFMNKLEQSHFEEPAAVEGMLYGDASEPSSFRASLSVSSPRVDSPWGRGNAVSVSAQVAPAVNGPFRADVKVQARNAVTPWGQAGGLTIEGRLAPSFTRLTPTNVHLSITVDQARTRWANAGKLLLLADFAPNPSDDAASLARYILRAQQVDTPWARSARLEVTSDAVLTSSNLWPSSAATKVQFSGGEAQGVRASGGTLEGTLSLPPQDRMEFSNTNLSWWTRLDRIGAGLRVELADIHSRPVDVKQLVFSADWPDDGARAATPLRQDGESRRLVLRDIRAVLYDGEINGRAELDTSTRRLQAAAKTTVDPRKVQSLLDTNTQQWLAQFTWEKPPILNGRASVTLPSWTNGASQFTRTDWNSEVLPTLFIDGDLDVGRGTYRGIAVESAQSAFTFSNLLWRLPNLVVTRPEGRAVIAHTGHSRTHEFTFDIDSTINPTAIGPLFSRAEREYIDMFVFTNPPRVRIQMAGFTHRPATTSFHAIVAATNLSFRELPVREVRTTITLTNQILTFDKPVVVRSEGAGRADSVQVDIPRAKIFINNATGSLDPWAVTHAVGSETEEAMKPYHFLNPPEARVHGVVDARDVSGSDLSFDLAGGPFEWMWFKFQQITGRVHWIGAAVTLSNVVGSMNGGRLEGSARFDFPPTAGSDFSFRVMVNDINLHSLISDLVTPTNKVEGTLNGVLVVNSANSDKPRSWQGYGNLAVNDGLLWDFPALGIFSPILNTFREGAGNSRAREAVATFGITNSVIYSRDLMIHASGNMRLRFNGTVDFDQHINGRMVAQLFRDTPGLGGLMSTVLWPVTKVFEYKVSGSLAQPNASPVYIPDFFTHPFRSLRQMGREKPEK